jgi:copper chaperone NosL
MTTTLLPRASLLLIASLLLAGCAIEPHPVVVGSEECAHCRMVIMDRGFATQALNTRGKAFSFDAIECLASWLITRDADGPEGEIHSLWVTDFPDPEGWLAAEEAYFVRSETIRSPMGLNLTAYADADVARGQVEAFGGEMLDWEGVLGLVRMEDSHGGGHGHAH